MAVTPRARYKSTGDWGGAEQEVWREQDRVSPGGRGRHHRSTDFRLLSLYFLICEMELRSPIS